MKDQKELGIGDFTAIPNGIGGVEHRMELMYQGVVNGEITLERWVETCCTDAGATLWRASAEGEILPGAMPTLSSGIQLRRRPLESTTSTT